MVLVGEPVEVSWDSPGATGVAVTVTSPTSIPTVLSPARSADQPQTWLAWFTPDTTGTWSVAWSSDESSTTQTVTVNQASDPAVLAGFTITDCYQSLNIAQAQWNAYASTYADMLFYLDSAIGVVEGIWGPITPTTVSDSFDGGDQIIALTKRPLTLISVMEDGKPSLDWVPNFDSATVHCTAGKFSKGIQNITVSYIAGTVIIPANVRLAVREQFRFLWQIGRQAQRASNADASVADPIPQGFAVPRRVSQLLGTADPLPGFA